MHVPTHEAPMCANCRKKAAVKRYVDKNFDEMVCAACFDRWTVQSAMDDKLIQLMTLEGQGQYDEALALLDEILEANRHLDHDGWLVRSILDRRALIFLDTQRYAEALEACEAWAQLGFGDVSERWMHALGTAHTLEPLGRDQEALDIIEDALGYQDPKYLPGVLGVLEELVRFSNKLGKPVDPKWLKLAEAAAERYGVEMPVRDSPAEAILALEELTRGKQPKRPKKADEESDEE